MPNTIRHIFENTRAKITEAEYRTLTPCLARSVLSIVIRNRLCRYIRNYNFHRALDRIVDVLPGLRVIWMECNSLPPKRLDDSFLQRCRARGIHELRNVGGVTEVTEQGIMDFIFARPSINLMIHLDMTYRRASRDLLRNLIEVSRCPFESYFRSECRDA